MLHTTIYLNYVLIRKVRYVLIALSVDMLVNKLCHYEWASWRVTVLNNTHKSHNRHAHMKRNQIIELESEMLHKTIDLNYVRIRKVRYMLIALLVDMLVNNFCHYWWASRWVTVLNNTHTNHNRHADVWRNQILHLASVSEMLHKTCDLNDFEVEK